MKNLLRGVMVLFLFSTVAACSSTTETASTAEPEKNTRMTQEQIDDCRSTGSRLAKRC